MNDLAEIREVLDKMADDVMRHGSSVFLCQQIVGEATRETLPDLLDAVQARLAACEQERDTYIAHADWLNARLLKAEEALRKIDALTYYDDHPGFSTAHPWKNIARAALADIAETPE